MGKEVNWGEKFFVEGDNEDIWYFVSGLGGGEGEVEMFFWEFIILNLNLYEL